jgi:N-acetylneuraminic acid mutarotase
LSANHRVQIETLPPLPRPLAYMTGAKVGDTLFVAGGQETISNPHATSHFYTLDLSQEGTPRFTWQERAAWPGPARIVPVSCALGEGPDAAFYLFSGRGAQPGELPQPLTDAYCYHPATDRWETLPPVPHCIMAASALPAGPHSLLLLGGDDGKIFTTLERLRRQIADAPDDDAKGRLTAQLNRMLDDHPGFSRDVLRYDAVTRRYTPAGTLPRPAPVTTPCVPWHGGLLLPSGEVRPGIRSPAVWLGRPTHSK